METETQKDRDRKKDRQGGVQKGGGGGMVAKLQELSFTEREEMFYVHVAKLEDL